MYLSVVNDRVERPETACSTPSRQPAFALLPPRPVAAQPIPCVLDEQVVTLGGAVEVAEYGASASDELADNAVAALGDRAAVLLRHHGVLGVGRDLEEAVAVVDLVERVAKIRILSLQIGDARELPPDVVALEKQMYRMMKEFREK